MRVELLERFLRSKVRGQGYVYRFANAYISTVRRWSLLV